MFYYYAAYVALMSILDMILMCKDKIAARQRKRRISERALLTCAAFGGALGGFLAMYLVRHKTKHWYFVFLMPTFVAVHAMLGYFIYQWSM